MQEKINWGILGCAGIARKSVIPAFKESKHASLIAIASRDNQKSRDWANQFNINTAYDTYEKLLSDPNIEAVYIPLPNALHREWVEKAAKAGKHILCEKPFAVSSLEAKNMLEICKANNVQVHEAFMWRFHPQTKKIMELVQAEALGDIRQIRGSFSYQIGEAPNVRLDASLAGGTLMDVGCYCVNFARHIMQAEPISVTAKMQFLPNEKNNLHKVDIATTGILEFANGATTMFSSRFDTPFDGQWMEIIGTKGKLFINMPFSPPTGEIHVLLNEKPIACTNANHFQLEIDEFSLSILDPTKPVNSLVGPLDSYFQALVIEGLYQSAYTGRSVTIN